MAITHTKEALADAIEQKTKQYWEDNEKPWLLSDVVPDLKKEGFDYKDLIAPLTIKNFAAGMSGKVKVVQHSSRKARVGIIPADKTYSFDDEVPTAKATERESPICRTHTRNTKYAVINFLQALATLGDEDLDKIVIPTSVLAKLVKDR